MECKNHWNEDLVSITTAKRWLVDNIEDAQLVEGPLAIYRSNDWGVTSLFKVTKIHTVQEVVLKIGFLPLFKTSPDIYYTLNKLASEHLITFCKGETIGDQTWLLFEKFEGEQVRTHNDFNLIKEMASTMGNIQVEFAKLNSVHKKGIPVYDFPTSIKTALTKFINQAIDEFVPVWNENATQIAEDYQLSIHELKQIADPHQLRKLMTKVNDVCDVLSELNIPLSIYHLDFHTNNAVVTANQQILLYDFEESVITCPFFVLDKLLDEVRGFRSDYTSERVYIDWSPQQLELRDAYLKRFTELEPSARLRMFDLSMAIAPLFYSFLSMAFLEQVGWESAIPGLMAESFIKSYARIQCLPTRLS